MRRVNPISLQYLKAPRELRTDNLLFEDYFLNSRNHLFSLWYRLSIGKRLKDSIIGTLFQWCTIHSLTHGLQLL